ncbi:MAG: 6,7-dimethyl-8-ribityllumazine synthase [Planctomycetota bacterium]|nr:MAG: 6,7-dimethyl-8-ribityllumazine synthase [Planctomycetota bacterium]
MRDIRGQLVATEGRFGIVVSRFNALVTDRLMDAACATFAAHGVGEDRLTVVRVPGAFEIPLAAHKLAESGDYRGVVCLGAVIQGETTHHDYINQQVAAGLMQTMLSTGVPVSFGILTCQTLDQALNRAGGKAGNKGVEATLAVLEMASVLSQIGSSQ